MRFVPMEGVSMREFVGMDQEDAGQVKLAHEAIKLSMETTKLQAETTKLQAEAIKLQAEAPRLNAETLKLYREAKWYPMFVILAILGAGAALGKLFL